MGNRKPDPERIKLQKEYMARCFALLEKQGITQNEAAKESGVTRQTLYTWKTGRNEMQNGRTIRRWHTYIYALLDDCQVATERKYRESTRDYTVIRHELNEGYRKITLVNPKGGKKDGV